MTEQKKIQVTVLEDTSIIDRIDAMAQAEGLQRADILRRAIRLLVFGVSVRSTGGSVALPDETTEPIAA
jgi:hypothetical protein